MADLISAGAVNLMAGSRTVTGVDTSWETSLITSGKFYAQGYVGHIDTVDSETQLTLTRGWPGPTQANAAYDIEPFSETTLAMMQAVTAMAAAARRVDAGSFVDPDAIGVSDADRSAYDDRDKGFVFVKITSTDYLVSVKRSATHADWGAYTSWLPVKGDAGSPGAAGTNGVGNYYDPSIQIPGRPPTGELYKTVFVRPVNFPSSLAASIGKAGTAADDDAVFAFLKNGVQFGTATFAAAATTATFAGTSTNFAPGDILSIVAPDPRDLTLADVLITLAGARL